MRYLLLCLCLLVSACATESNQVTDVRIYLIKSWGEGTVIPWYEDFVISSGELKSAVDTFCTEPGPQSIEPIKTAWRKARVHWKRTEVIAFGPYKDEPYRVVKNVDFWPARPSSVESVLQGTSGVGQSDVSQMGAGSKGFPAIEYLVWADIENEWEGRRCDYLRGLTADLALQAGILKEAWDPEEGDYLGAMLRSGSDGGAFPSLLDAAGEIPNRMAHTIANIRRDKLGGLESPFALHAKADILANLEGIEALFEGTEGYPGTAAILERSHSELAARVRVAFIDARNAINAIDDPLTPETDVAQTDAADNALRNLHTLLYKDVLKALGFEETFNDADGD